MNKSRITALLCAIAVTASGCAAAADSSSEGQTDSSSQTAAPAAEPAASDSRQEEFEELTHKLEQMTKRIDELEKRVKTFSYDAHDIYDDTAVIEAYKKSDSSSLEDEKDRFVYESLTAALKEIIKAGMTDYEKEKAVYDYIFKNANYNYKNLNPVVDDTVEDNSHTPYGFFRDHSVICVGYATTFKLFMDALDIECRIIHSTEQGEHAWNVVKIGGKWHHVDVFFDGGTQHPLYGAFNVTDELKQQQGYPWNTGSGPVYPECTSLEYNPVVREAKECKSIYELPKKLAEIGGEDGTGSAFFKLAVPEGAGAYGFCQQLDAILTNIAFESKQISYKCFADAGTGCCYISVSIEIPDDIILPDDSDISDDPDYRYADIDYDRLSRDLYSAFGNEVTFYIDGDQFESSMEY